MTAFAWPLAAERLTRCHAEFLCHTYSTSLHRYSIHLPATRGTLAWVDSPLVVVYGDHTGTEGAVRTHASAHILVIAFFLRPGRPFSRVLLGVPRLFARFSHQQNSLVPSLLHQFNRHPLSREYVFVHKCTRLC